MMNFLTPVICKMQTFNRNFPREQFNKGLSFAGISEIANDSPYKIQKRKFLFQTNCPAANPEDQAH